MVDLTSVEKKRLWRECNLKRRVAASNYNDAKQRGHEITAEGYETERKFWETLMEKLK